MAGNFDVMFDTVVATRQHIQSGKLKLLAVVARERLAAFPDAPTIAEAGFPTVPLGLWIGMLFPKGTPADIVDKVSKQLNKDLTDPELVKKFVDLGAVPHPSSPKDFAQFIKAEYVRMGKLVQESGAKAD